MKNEIIRKIQELEDRHAKLEEFAPFLSGMRQTTVWDDGNCEGAVLPVGQSIGLIHDVVSCKDLVERMVKEAETLLKGASKRLSA